MTHHKHEMNDIHELPAEIIKIKQELTELHTAPQGDFQCVHTEVQDLHKQLATHVRKFNNQLDTHRAQIADLLCRPEHLESGCGC